MFAQLYKIMETLLNVDWASFPQNLRYINGVIKT